MIRITKKLISKGTTISLGPDCIDKQYYIFIGEQSIKLTPPGQITPNYIKKTTKQGSISLGNKILNAAGLRAGQRINVFHTKDEIIMSYNGMEFIPKEDEQTLKIEKTESYVPDDEYIQVPARNDGCTSVISIPQLLLDQAGIERDVEVKINNNIGLWLEISKLTNPNIETRTNLRHRLGNMIGKVDGVVFKDTLAGKFVKSMKISRMIVSAFGAQEKPFNMWYNKEKNCIVVEAPTQICNINDEEIRSLPEVPKELDVCPECMNETTAGGMLRELIKMNEQLKEERMKLEALLAQVS